MDEVWCLHPLAAIHPEACRCPQKSQMGDSRRMVMRAECSDNRILGIGTDALCGIVNQKRG